MYGVILALKIFITILFIAIILIIMLLVIPYNYVIQGDINEEIKGEIRINWLLGLLKFTFLKTSDDFEIKFYFINFCVYSNLRKNSNKHIEKNSNKNRKISVNFQLLELDTLRKLFLYLKDIILIVKPRSITIDGIYGLDDPFATGTISAVVSVIKSNFSAIRINISPVFDELILDVFIEIKGRINLFIVILRTVKLLLKKDLRKIVLKGA